MITNKDIFGTLNIDKIADMLSDDVSKKGANAIELYNKYLPALYLEQSFNTVATRYTKLRNAIKHKRSKTAKELLEIMNLPSEYHTLINKVRSDIALDKKNNKKELSLNFVKDVLKDVKQIITSKDFQTSTRQSKEQIEIYYLAFYLALNTGRRFTEVLKTMDIEKHGKKITMYGIIKKKSNEFETLENAYIIDDDYIFTKKCLKRLRELFNATELTNDEVAKKNSFIFNQYMKKHILNCDDYTFNDLRKMYAQMIWEKYADKENENQKDFFCKVLGHDIKADSTDHYLIFKTKKD